MRCISSKGNPKCEMTWSADPGRLLAAPDTAYRLTASPEESAGVERASRQGRFGGLWRGRGNCEDAPLAGHALGAEVCRSCWSPIGDGIRQPSLPSG